MFAVYVVLYYVFGQHIGISISSSSMNGDIDESTKKEGYLPATN